jgi:hypothetical protein
MKKRLLINTLVIFFMVGAFTMPVWSADAPRMGKDELKAMLGNPDLVIMDVRAKKDWTDGDSKIKGAIREDPESVKSWVEKYSKDKTIVLYCA